ncbi:gas vesicle protein GvpO [Streptomyces sp. NPDC056503]|uniref:gas vesicle protein GvpO n=1 Tax=Streptomyces sp. NPDC056503 TaxID=3345842 RepID=UPI0036AC1423
MAAAEPARSRRPPADQEDAQDRDARTGRPARKAAARKPPARKAPARRGVTGTAAAMRAAVEQLAQLLGRVPESVSSLRPTEDGWEAQVEVLELERIPDTTSILASYKVAIDKEGELISYERTRRYSRGMIDRPT